MSIKDIHNVDAVYLHTNSAIKKASVLLTEGENPYIMEKVSSHIDGHKQAAVKAMYELSKSSLEKEASLGSTLLGAGKTLGTGLLLGGGMALASPLIGAGLGSGAAHAAKQTAEETVNEWKMKALIGVPAAVLAVGAAARAGFLGEGAQDYVEAIPDKVKNLFASKEEKPSSVSQYMPFKIAVAKTYCKLERAQEKCSSAGDREKLASALKDCSVTLFDLMIYL